MFTKADCGDQIRLCSQKQTVGIKSAYVHKSRLWGSNPPMFTKADCGDQIRLCSQKQTVGIKSAYVHKSRLWGSNPSMFTKADCVLITHWQVSFQSFHTLASVLPHWQMCFHTSKCMCTWASVLTVQQQTVSRHTCKSPRTFASVVTHWQEWRVLAHRINKQASLERSFLCLLTQTLFSTHIKNVAKLLLSEPVHIGITVLLNF